MRPERRTRSDLVVSLLLCAAVLAGSGVIWWFGDARATESRQASNAVRPLPPARQVPDELHRLWRAKSPATEHPVVAGPSVVTGQGGTVRGRHPVSGRSRWYYSRDLKLCTVGAEWRRALAVYRTDHNCSEVTALSGSDGERAAQRNTDVGFGTRLLSDGSYVTATGTELLETWRSDLVRTQQYGIPTDVKIPDNNNPRPRCDYSSTTMGDRRVAVIEECPGEQLDRLTVLKARPEDDEQPEEELSTIVADDRARVVAVTGEFVAVLLGDRGEFRVYDMAGDRVTTTEVNTANSDVNRGGSPVEPVQKGDRIYWYTGHDTVALNRQTLKPVWTVRNTLGTPTEVAGKVLIPVPGGLAVHDPTTGQRARVIKVDRGDFDGVVRTDSVADVILEQRGDEVFAYR